MSVSPSDLDRWPDRALVFEVWGDYACFRRFYTTRSPLSFPVPPRPTLAGLVGAIAGIEKGQVAGAFADDRARLAIALVAPMKTIRLGINWVETKKPVLRCGLVEERTQVNVEFLKDPRFRVYALLRDGSQRDDLARLLREHRSVYTPSLGVSELLADFAWCGEWPAQANGAGVVDVRSALPVKDVVWPDAGEGIQFEAGKHYDRKRVPRLLDGARAVTEWQDLVVETSAQTIRAHVANGWKVGDDYVVWL